MNRGRRTVEGHHNLLKQHIRADKEKEALVCKSLSIWPLSNPHFSTYPAKRNTSKIQLTGSMNFLKGIVTSSKSLRVRCSQVFPQMKQQQNQKRREVDLGTGRGTFENIEEELRELCNCHLKSRNMDRLEQIKQDCWVIRKAHLSFMAINWKQDQWAWFVLKIHFFSQVQRLIQSISY